MATSQILETVATEPQSTSPSLLIHPVDPSPSPQVATTGRQSTASSNHVRSRNLDSGPVGRSHSITDQTSRLPFHHLISAYACLAGIYFISTLDINAVALALPTIGEDLDVGSAITWAGTAYLMGQVAFQPLYGRFSDIFGRKPLLMACVAFLILGDIFCGLARTATWLYIARALSGIGGGGISSLISIIVSDLVNLRDRGKYQSILSCAIGLGAGVGPFLAAALLQVPMRAGTQSWRWIFFVPPIVAAACALAANFFLPLKPVEGNWKRKLRQIDWMGVGTALVGMMCILIPINLGGTVWPWTSYPVAVMLSVGGAAVIAFTVVEKRFAAIPMIPLHLFAKRSPMILILQSSLYNLVWQVDLYFLPAYFQSIRGFTALETALLMVPLLVMQSAFGVVSGPLMSKFQSYGYILHPGMVLWLLGTAMKIAYDKDTSIAYYIVSLSITGWGIGFVFQPALVALQALCAPQDRAIATSTRNMFRMLGSVVGMTIATALQTAVTQKAMPTVTPPIIQSEASSGMSNAAVLNAKMQGFRAVFAMEVPMMVLCCVGCFWISSVRLAGDEPDDQHEATNRLQS